MNNKKKQSECVDVQVQVQYEVTLRPCYHSGILNGMIH